MSATKEILPTLRSGGQSVRHKATRLQGHKFCLSNSDILNALLSRLKLGVGKLTRIGQVRNHLRNRFKDLVTVSLQTVHFFLSTVQF